MTGRRALAGGPVLIIGSRSDPHATAVGGVVEAAGGTPCFLDAASIGDGGWRWLDAQFELAIGSNWEPPRRAWLRRLAPADWHHGIVLGSIKAAEASASLALLTALSDGGPTWLTTYWATTRAESKLVQDAVCRDMGIPAPRTIVCTSPDQIERALGSQAVVKPLGVGEFSDGGTHHVVHTSLVSTHDLSGQTLTQAPFIVQQRINASRHLRIVTVTDQAWTSTLDAAGLPVDWRASSEAHSSWDVGSGFAAEELAAVQLAKALDLGYSSQDWIVDLEGKSWLIDVNPAGQWLFLPPPVATAVTDAIGTWLVTQ